MTDLILCFRYFFFKFYAFVFHIQLKDLVSTFTKYVYHKLMSRLYNIAVSLIIFIFTDLLISNPYLAWKPLFLFDCHTKIVKLLIHNMLYHGMRISFTIVFFSYEYLLGSFYTGTRTPGWETLELSLLQKLHLFYIGLIVWNIVLKINCLRYKFLLN